MKELKHENIARLYGVYTQEEPILIIIEFMIHEYLLNYLRDGPGKKISN